MMKSLIGAVAMLLLGVDGPVLGGPPEADQRFSRNQGRLEGLARWGNEIAVRSTPPCKLNLESRACVRISIPLLDEVLAVAGDTARFAVGMRKGRPALVREQGGAWEEVSLPDAARAGGLEPAALGASGDEIALIEIARTRGDRPAKVLLVARHQGAWSSTGLDAAGLYDVPRHVAFARGRWLLGYDSGEWGGQLSSVEPGGAVTEIGPRDHKPVTGIAVAPDGRIYVSTGLAHLTGLSAHVGYLDRDWQWTTLLRVSNHDQGAGGGWNLRPDTVTGLSVDAGGRLYLLTGSQGVVRVDAGKLVPVTPGWPQGHLYGKGLMIDRDTAVIGTFDSGVVIWKLGTDQGRRVEVPFADAVAPGPAPVPEEVVALKAALKARLAALDTVAIALAPSLGEDGMKPPSAAQAKQFAGAWNAVMDVTEKAVRYCRDRENEPPERNPCSSPEAWVERLPADARELAGALAFNLRVRWQERAEEEARGLLDTIKANDFSLLPGRDPLFALDACADGSKAPVPDESWEAGCRFAFRVEAAPEETGMVAVARGMVGPVEGVEYRLSSAGAQDPQRVAGKPPPKPRSLPPGARQRASHASVQMLGEGLSSLTPVYAFGAGMTRPTRRWGANPVYTREALNARVQGLMIVKCIIDTDGYLRDCMTVKPLPLMETAVLDALQTRRYWPVTYQGHPVACDYVFNIKLVMPTLDPMKPGLPE